MPARSVPPQPRSVRTPSVRQVRLAAGLVLFTYVTLHSANHALGNISIDAMESGLAIQKAIWQSTPGAITLHAALTIHMCLGFWALYERRHFRWSWMEAMQLALGLTIPFLLADHVLGRRVSLSLFGTEKGYAEVLLKLWVRDPLAGILQSILLLVVRIHGRIGIHLWLRLKPLYPRVREPSFRSRCFYPHSRCSATTRAASEHDNWSRIRFGRRATRRPSVLERRPRTPLFSATARIRSRFLRRCRPS